MDVIAGAFSPEQVIKYLKANLSTIYSDEAVEQIKIGKGVQGRYKGQVLAYYGRQNQSGLKDKTKWITEDFIRGRLS